MTKYRTIDVLMGLRSEYVKLQGKLEVLGLLTDISADRSVSRARYSVVRPHDMSDKPEIVCVYDDNPRTLRGKINYLRKYVFGTYIWGIDDDYPMRDKKGNIVLSGSQYKIEKSKHRAVVNQDMQDIFGNLFDEILSSSIYRYENQNDLTSDDLKLIARLADGFALFSRSGDYRLDYSEHSDCLHVRGDGELVRATKDALENHMFDGIKLTEYEKELMASSGSVGKKLYVTSYGPALERTTFDISEDENSILLIKKN